MELKQTSKFIESSNRIHYYFIIVHLLYDNTVIIFICLIGGLIKPAIKSNSATSTINYSDF